MFHLGIFITIREMKLKYLVPGTMLILQLENMIFVVFLILKNLSKICTGFSQVKATKKEKFESDVSVTIRTWWNFVERL